MTDIQGTTDISANWGSRPLIQLWKKECWLAALWGSMEIVVIWIEKWENTETGNKWDNKNSIDQKCYYIEGFVFIDTSIQILKYFLIVHEGLYFQSVCLILSVI